MLLRWCLCALRLLLRRRRSTREISEMTSRRSTPPPKLKQAFASTRPGGAGWVPNGLPRHWSSGPGVVSRRTGFWGSSRIYAFKTLPDGRNGLPREQGLPLRWFGTSCYANASVLQPLATLASGARAWDALVLLSYCRPVTALSVHHINPGSGQQAAACTYQAPTKALSQTASHSDSRYKCQPS